MKICEERIRGMKQGTNDLGGCGVRTLTVSSLFRQWGPDHRRTEAVVPGIRLNGKWLAALGILPGQKIRVVTDGATIIIAPVSPGNEVCPNAK
jgi:hypothetical protein